MSTYRIGEFVEGEGIYFGRWSPKNRYGIDLGTYDLFTTKKDLTDGKGKTLFLQYANCIQEVARRKNLHGHNGRYFESDRAIYAAMENGTYRGEWILAPRELLHGRAAGDSCGSDKIVQKDNLFSYRQVGELDKTFSLRRDDGCLYASSTESREKGYFSIANFSNGHAAYQRDNYGDGLIIRPIRAKLVTAPANRL